MRLFAAPEKNITTVILQKTRYGKVEIYLNLVYASWTDFMIYKLLANSN